MTRPWSKIAKRRLFAFLLRHDRIFRNDVEGELDADFGMQLHLHGVLAESLHRRVQVDPLLVDLDAGLGQLRMNIGGGNRPEHLATFTGGYSKGQGGCLKLLGKILRTGELGGFALHAALFERFDLLPVGAGYWHRD